MTMTTQPTTTRETAFIVVIPTGYRRARVVSVHATLEAAENDLESRLTAEQRAWFAEGLELTNMFVMQGADGRKVGDEIEVLY